MKRFKLFSSSDSSSFADIPIKWDLCILCQEVKRKALQCPNDSKRCDKGAGYKSLAVNLKQFRDMLAQFPGMTAQSHGKEVLLVCDSDTGNALSTACDVDTDVEA